MPKFLLAASVALAMNSFGQLRGNLFLSGEVQHDPSTSVRELSTELYDPQQHQVIERAPVMQDGSFEFRNVSTGNYEVRLINRYGDAIRSEYVNLNQASERVIFRNTERVNKPVNGAIGVSQLQHHVSRKALREFRLAAKATAKGDQDAAVAHLDKSIDADGQFAGAHHQLGVALLARGATDQALAEFQKTVELDPALAIGHSNLAIVLMKLNRFDEAETAARRAIQLEPSNAKAHFVLALSLLRQQKHRQEALNHLHLAYEEFPQARAIGLKLEAQ